MEEVGRSDVLVHNMRPGVMEELGLGSDVMLAKNPRLVYARSGRWAARPAQAQPRLRAHGAGLLGPHGHERRRGQPAHRVGTSLLDFGTGMWAAMGALAGSSSAAAPAAAAWWTLAPGDRAGLAHRSLRVLRISGEVPVRHRTGSSRLIPFEGFETKNGEIIIAAGNDRLFAKLATALGRPEWATDPRYAKNTGRSAHKEDILGKIRESSPRAPRASGWTSSRRPACPARRSTLSPRSWSIPRPRRSRCSSPCRAPSLELVALPLNFDGEKPRIRRAPPTLGEHNAEIRGHQEGRP